MELANTVEHMKGRSNEFKGLGRQHLSSWYENFFMSAAINGWNFEGACDALDVRRKVSNKNAQLVTDEVKDGVKKYILEVISNKIEVSCSLLKPFVENYIKSEYPEEY